MTRTAESARIVLSAALVVAGALAVSPARAQDDVGGCEDEIVAAEQEFGVPEGLLAAIGRVEAGRNGKPWPWTLNVAGRGALYSTREEAIRAAEAALSAGERSIDVGCFQINHRWHFRSGGWPSVAWMIHPANNVRYAAFFLSDLRWQHGSWTEAVGRYHSGGNPALQNRYLCAVLNELGAADPACAGGRLAQATSSTGSQTR